MMLDKRSTIDVPLSNCPSPAPQSPGTSISFLGYKTRRLGYKAKRNIIQNPCKWEPWELLILQANFKVSTHPSRTQLEEIGRKLREKKQRKQKKQNLCDGDLEKENQHYIRRVCIWFNNTRAKMRREAQGVNTQDEAQTASCLDGQGVDMNMRSECSTASVEKVRRKRPFLLSPTIGRTDVNRNRDHVTFEGHRPWNEERTCYVSTSGCLLLSVSFAVSCERNISKNNGVTEMEQEVTAERWLAVE